MELFDLPSRLTRDQHAAVFGTLPSRLAAALADAATAELVRPLLARGWRPGQIASRVGAMPAPADGVGGVQALLRALQAEATPAERAARNRAARGRAKPAAAPAAPEVKQRYVAQIRRELGLTSRRAPQAQPPRVRRCVLCEQDSGYFVTHEVRLCPACVQVLATGRARLVAAG